MFNPYFAFSLWPFFFFWVLLGGAWIMDDVCSDASKRVIHIQYLHEVAPTNKGPLYWVLEPHCVYES